MKGMVLQKPAAIEHLPLVLKELQQPKPRGYEVLIKVLACGVCHTDLDIAEGRLECPNLPIVPGHQVVGVIAACGPKASAKFKLKQRVGVTWLWKSCCKCVFCKSQRQNLCADALWTGLNVNGGYADYMLADSRFIHPLPAKRAPRELAPLLCAGVIGYRTIRLSQIVNGQTIGLFGFGASAHIVIQILKHIYSKSRIYVFTRSTEHQALARHLGAYWAGNSASPPKVLLDRAMDFTPLGQTVKSAMDLLQKGGRLVINAIRKTTPIPPMDYTESLWHEKQLQSVANVSRQDIKEFFALLRKINIQTTVQTYTLEQANQALLDLKQSRINGAAVLTTV